MYTDEEIQIVLNDITENDFAYERQEAEQWRARYKGRVILAYHAVIYDSEASLKKALRLNYAMQARERMKTRIIKDRAARGAPELRWDEHCDAKDRIKILDKLIELGHITLERIR